MTSWFLLPVKCESFSCVLFANLQHTPIKIKQTPPGSEVRAVQQEFKSENSKLVSTAWMEPAKSLIPSLKTTYTEFTQIFLSRKILH